MVAKGDWRGMAARLLALAVALVVMAVLAAGLSTPAQAQSDEGGGGGGGWGQRLCDGASLVPAPGTGLICDTGRAAVDRVAGGDEGSGERPDDVRLTIRCVLGVTTTSGGTFSLFDEPSSSKTIVDALRETRARFVFGGVGTASSSPIAVDSDPVIRHSVR